MKQRFLLLLLLPMLLAAVEQQPAWNAPVQYRGFTMTPSLNREANVRALERMKREFRANIVRLHLHTRMCADHWLRSKTYQPAWNALLQEIPPLLDKAKLLGLATVISIHTLPYEKERELSKRLKGAALSKAVWNDPEFSETLIRCWKELAGLCRERKDQVIWFDIFNEPLDRSTSTMIPEKWHEIAQETTDEIRKIDRIHPIVFEPGPGGLYGGFQTCRPLRDTIPVIYSLHSYMRHEYTHQLVGSRLYTDLARLYKKRTRYPHYPRLDVLPIWNRKKMMESFRVVRDFQKKHKVRIFVGEWSCARYAPDVEAYFQDSIDLFEEYGWDWTYHGWEESPVWNIEYAESLENRKSAAGARAEILRKAMAGEVPVRYHSRLRGFEYTPGRENPLALREMKEMIETWNVNLISLRIDPVRYAYSLPDGGSEKAFSVLLEKLPPLLKFAAEKNCTVILTLCSIPNDRLKKIVRSLPEKRFSGKRLPVKYEKAADLTQESERRQLLSCWRRIATLFRSAGQNLCYDLLDEPENPEIWHPLAQECIDEIRRIDRSRVLVFQPGPGKSHSGFAELKPLKDRGGEILYCAKSYDPVRFTLQALPFRAALDEGIVWQERKKIYRDYAEWRKKGNVCMYPLLKEGTWNEREYGFRELMESFSPVLKFREKYRKRILVKWGCVRWAPNAARYCQESIRIFENAGLDWCYRGFREDGNVWDVDYGELWTDQNPAPEKSTRMEFFQRAFEKNGRKEK